MLFSLVPLSDMNGDAGSEKAWPRLYVHIKIGFV